jgi:hypothetical protein
MVNSKSKSKLFGTFFQIQEPLDLNPKLSAIPCTYSLMLKESVIDVR